MAKININSGGSNSDIDSNLNNIEKRFKSNKRSLIVVCLLLAIIGVFQICGIVDEQKQISRFKQALFNSRDYVLQTFKKYIPGPAEVGLAEALLVGYRDDLDKNLVEQYASTGVVHIIAISGMHFGLIYGSIFRL